MNRFLSLTVFLALSMAAPATGAAPAAAPPGKPAAGTARPRPWEPRERVKIRDKSGYCIECHREKTPGLFRSWVEGPHARIGVGCNDCHGASPSDKDAFLHQQRFYITTAVTPFDCARCHPDAIRDFYNSGHAEARIRLEKMGPDDPRYPLVAPYRDGGFAECAGCHGARVRLDEDRRPGLGTWPNAGIGRLNPDGSRGNCAACHPAHRFAAEDARRPEACLGCHDGPDYPEGAIYLHSPHGRVAGMGRARDDLSRPGFFCDTTRYEGPTCGLCHFNGAGRDLVTRHNPAWRLTRDLLHPEAPEKGRPEDLRGNMDRVCQQCHAASVVKRFFASADEKLARYQSETVRPRLAGFRKRLKHARGKKRRRLLEEYGAFLREAKAFRLNLYMGVHGRSGR
ncbi:hypothetical protein G3N55_00945 [Dissulfurirhabdus thermomarina]|uniref:Cytochrome c-552/4 domain-containing protein n=1 Tax=Dissulfurirhabdus thermomarina TaxID=1765737 RepID=A0A6N9TK07_DISTH|nr:multiheme c-type cytochrome [Dissulfurirhabdus thermomarina]NDY41419.1 hypothetical protein [Dissulfurirhabdus thermomarina]NMX24407.1 hypothetical protein [Dissulfurirhabdus thermomarina]